MPSLENCAKQSIPSVGEIIGSKSVTVLKAESPENVQSTSIFVSDISISDKVEPVYI